MSKMALNRRKVASLGQTRSPAHFRLSETSEILTLPQPRYQIRGGD